MPARQGLMTANVGRLQLLVARASCSDGAPALCGASHVAYVLALGTIA